MKLSRLLLIAVLPLAVVSAVFMILAFSAYDPAVSNYFPNGSPLPILSVVSAFLAFAAGAVSALLSRKKSEPFAVPSVPSFALLPAAVGNLAGGVLLLTAGKTLSGVLFLFGVAFFALLACPFAKRYAPYITWLGFAAIAAHISLVAAYYFDMTVEMNAPIKVLLQMGLLAAMLDCTVEIRLLMDRSHAVITPIIIAFAIVCCGLSSISLSVAFLGGKIPEKDYSAALPVLLGFTATAVCRLAALLQSPKENLPATDIESELSENDHPNGGKYE